VLKQKTDHQVSGKGNRFVDSPLFYHESVYFSDGCVIITSSIKQEVNMAELSKEQKREIAAAKRVAREAAQVEAREKYLREQAEQFAAATVKDCDNV
jgi:hypothetical protein